MLEVFRDEMEITRGQALKIPHNFQRASAEQKRGGNSIILLLSLALTRPPRIPVDHSFRPPLGYPRFNPVTLPLADSHHHRRLHHCQLTAKHSLYNL